MPPPTLITQMLLTLSLIAFARSAPVPESTTDISTTTKPLELFLPVGSTTALMCEPIFSGDSRSATWYKNGEVIATVTSKSNALLPNRTYEPEQNVPEVGFLIVSDIRREDEGTYECIDDITGSRGDPSRLTVAYVSLLPIEGHISMEPKRITMGGPLQIRCNPPDATPTPTITWQLNGAPLNRYAPDASVFSNGTLYIPRFTLSHLGLYVCTASNFAGKTLSRYFIDAKDLLIDRTIPDPESDISAKCTYFFRACVLWFLIGCLSTSCIVLIYLLLALCCLSPPRRRLTVRPSIFSRSHPSLGPGFRKPIMPMPDYMRAPTQPPPPQPIAS